MKPETEREAGTAERAEQLVSRLPISNIVGTPKRVAVGTPYMPEGGIQVALPVLVAGPFGEDVILGVDLSLGTQVRHFRRSSSPTHGMALVDANGRAIIGGDHPLIDAQGLRPLLGNRAFFTQTIGSSQVKGAVAPVPYTDWTLVVAEPASLAQLPATEIQAQTARIVLFSLLLAVGAGVVLARSVSTPVADLRESALAVASGQYGQQTAVSRMDELADLAAAFNHMSERLLTNQTEIRAQQAEIEAFADELQERVNQRTQELVDAQSQLVRAGQLAAVAEVEPALPMN